MIKGQDELTAVTVAPGMICRVALAVVAASKSKLALKEPISNNIANFLLLPQAYRV